MILRKMVNQMQELIKKKIEKKNPSNSHALLLTVDLDANDADQVMLTYHSAHNRSGPTSSRRCASTLLKATRKYAKKLRICRLTPLLNNVRSARPKAEYSNFDVIVPFNTLFSC